MAKVEIDEAELGQLRALGLVVQKLNGDQNAKKHLERALKVVDPNLRTEDDVAETYAGPLREELGTIRKTLEDRFGALEARETKQREDRAQLDLDTSFSNLRKTHGYTDDGVAAVQKIMVDRNIPDVEAAAALFERMNPPAAQEQPAYEPSHWNLESNAVVDTEALFRDPDKWESKEIANTLTDMRRQAA